MNRPSTPVRPPAHDDDVLIDQHSRHHRLIDTAAMGASLEERVIALMFHKAYRHAASLVDAGPVLDLGCNTGYGTAILRERTPHRVVGVDVSPRALETARARWGGEFCQVDGKRLPFPDGTFGAVTCFQVIEHIGSTRPFLAEIRRVLRPGGKAIFTTPNATTRIDPGERPWNRFHVREYRPAELDALLRETFSDVTVFGLFGTPGLERIEAARLHRLRRIGKIRNRFAWLMPLPVEDWLIRMVRSVLARVRPDTRAEADANPELTVDDLDYRTEAPERSLDLLAVCR